MNFTVKEKSGVVISIFNSNGELNSVVDEGIKNAGIYSEEVDTKNFQPGIYFMRLSAGEEIATKKFIIAR